MTDLDALRLAVLANPDDDLPRLVYADCLDENGDPDRAAFIRAQVELAKTPEYEPFAVYCKTRRPEWVTGEPWCKTLPELPENGPLTWAEPTMFRRGFGAAIRATFVPALRTALPKLLRTEPIEDLRLGTATLEQWQDMGTLTELSQIRSLTFFGLTSPNEALRVFRHSQFTTGVRHMRLGFTNIPSIPEIFEDLFATTFGKRLEKLEMQFGYGSADDWVDAIATQHPVSLSQYRLFSVGFGPSAMRAFVDSGLASQTEELNLTRNPVGPDGVEILVHGASRLHVLGLHETGLDERAAETLALSGSFRELRWLNLSGNPLRTAGIKRLSRSTFLTRLRSLRLKATHADNAAVRYLTRGTFWPNLVELDLTGNPISDAGAKHFMTARPAPDLTSLRLPARNLSDGMKADLREKFGEVVGFSE